MSPVAELKTPSKKFARQNCRANPNPTLIRRELYAGPYLIQPHHLPISSAPGAGKGDRTPAVT
jgi:hypothetical protein